MVDRDSDSAPRASSHEKMITMQHDLVRKIFPHGVSAMLAMLVNIPAVHHASLETCCNDHSSVETI